ncbi:hypothetical protein PYW07_007209 [Mythimna separata]|uniref:Uncharacterized protein n=1 Tax=Mythimna separata TaxID=271217 RepID=A0AAD7Z061_MYTSE|nr:hypothetical protein PYW07_007209 [Mythimna separata]
MAAATAPRKTVSIYDYPEHLNPFHEEDNHNKIRFWTLGRRLNRSNSISFSGLKDLKNSWALRSFMKKGKKGTSSEKSSTNQLNGETSPIIYRRALQYSATPTSSVGARSTVASPERGDRYVYGGSITPLPRSRFQERLRSTSHHEVQSLSATPRLARSEVSGSRLSVESTNPFEEDGPVAPVRASRRKKKRAPLPPEATHTTPDSAVTTAVNVTEIQRSETEEKILNKNDGDLELEDMNLNIELKIVEDEDVKDKNADAIEVKPTTPDTLNNNEVVDVVTLEKSESEQTNTEKQLDITESEDSEVKIRNSSSDEDILNSSAFHKVDIIKYRRNSSVNEDDIRLRRGNLEDFQSLSNKRSRSLTNALNTTYTTFDINLNEDTTHMDTNGNDGPKKVVCKLYEDPQIKKSIETISSTEKEFLEIDRATRQLEREINKLNSALNEDDIPCVEARLSVSEIKRRFDKNDTSSPNPIPKPRRSHYGGGSSTP